MFACGGVSSAFLGLTMNCARCHNHKLEPITQRDYYRLQAVFAELDRLRLADGLRPLTAHPFVSAHAAVQALASAGAFGK